MERIHTAFTAGVEKRLLIWMAGHLPRAINSDHLTFTAAAALLGVGVCAWIGGDALILVLPLLAVNWFGDSLDGTVARVRREERPRYGYYVDHVLDAAGFATIFGGFMLGGLMSAPVGLGFVASYFLVTTEVAMATTARGTFRLAAFGVGPTELRIFLAAGVLQAARSPFITLFGHDWLLFDVGGVLGIAGLLTVFVLSAIRNGVALYREEPRIRILDPGSRIPHP